MAKKNKTLLLIQVAWPLEVLIAILYTMFIVALNPEASEAWIKALGPLSLLIGAQGGAASVGPAVKDVVESRRPDRSGQSDK